jgi:hypothetical protein
MKGNVTHVKQVRNLNRGGQNTVVQIKPLKGNPTIVDLGPTQPLLNLALAKGDTLAVGGRRQNIGQYSVLMAQHVNSGVNEVSVDRSDTVAASDRKEATGRIERISDVRIRGTEQMHRVAAVKGADGHLMLVDLGMQPCREIIQPSALPVIGSRPAGRLPLLEIIPCSLPITCRSTMGRQ